MTDKKIEQKLLERVRKLARWMERNGIDHVNMFAFSPDNAPSIHGGDWFVSATASVGEKRVANVSGFYGGDEL